MRIKKIFNNNALCVIDKRGRELIVTGRGLGYHKRIGEVIDPKLIQKVYRMEDPGEQKKLRELVQQIPIEELEFTEKLIQEIKKEIPQTLNESLLITLTDHISFAIKRKKEGIEFTNPLAGSVICYYPAEHQIGLHCLSMIEEEYGIRLNNAEASFIALHIVNAELNTEMSEIYGITDIIDGCVDVVEAFYKKKFDHTSLRFSRFIVHLRYFAQRIVHHKLTVDQSGSSDEEFREMMFHMYPTHYQCAKKIGEYISNTRNILLTEEELVYLTVHLKRINDSESEE